MRLILLAAALVLLASGAAVAVLAVQDRGDTPLVEVYKSPT